MKRFSILVICGLAAILLVSMVSADGGGARTHFIGLWEGVDPNDGSRRTVSITDNDRDGNFEVSHYDTFWSLCGDDSAVTEGSGTIGGDGVLHWSGTLTCRSNGTTVPLSVDYMLVPQSDTLIESAVGIPLLPDLLHRTS